MKYIAAITISILIALTVFSTNAPAQEATDTGNYNPPPLFGKPRLPPAKTPAQIQSQAPKFPNLSKDVKNDDVKTDIPQQGLPAIHSPAVTDSPTPIIQQKKSPPPAATTITSKPEVTAPDKKTPFVTTPDFIEKAAAIKPTPKPSTPPIQPATTASTIASPEKPQVKSSSGVIKGTKSMPAAKKEAVEAQETFIEEPAKTPISDMLLRVQQDAATKEEEENQANKEPSATDKAKAAIRRMEVKEAPPPNEVMDDGRQKITLSFDTNQSTLNDEQRAIIDHMILPKLDEAMENTVLVQSYASKLEGVLNSDRRLALDRAMAIRTYLLEQTIQPHRITVRALGNDSQNTAQTPDRAELYIKTKQP